MSEEQQSPVGDSASISDNAQESQSVASGNDSVAYETFKKLLGEKKAVASQKAELEMKLNSLENDRLQSEGKKDELIEKLQKQLGDYSTKVKETERKFGYATLSSQVKTEAVKMGCQDPDTLLKVLDLDSVIVDPDTFTADVDNIRIMLSDTKKVRPYFFGKPAPNVNDVDQNNSIVNKDDVNFNSMTRDEISDFIKLNKNKF